MSPDPKKGQVHRLWIHCWCVANACVQVKVSKSDLSESIQKYGETREVHRLLLMRDQCPCHLGTSRCTYWGWEEPFRHMTRMQNFAKRRYPPQKQQITKMQTFKNRKSSTATDEKKLNVKNRKSLTASQTVLRVIRTAILTPASTVGNKQNTTFEIKR